MHLKSLINLGNSVYVCVCGGGGGGGIKKRLTIFQFTGLEFGLMKVRSVIPVLATTVPEKVGSLFSRR